MAANVRRLRARRELTQEDLANRVDVDVTYVRRIERAQVNLTVSTLVAFAEALDVQTGLLLRKAELAPPKRGRPKKKRTRPSGRG